MNIESLLIAKVYRKKEVQEITDRNTGRVTGLYYPVILDDGNDTFNMTVPQDTYENICEGNTYCFVTRFNDSYVRDNQHVKPKIVSIFSPVPDFSGSSDFVKEFYNLVSDVLNPASSTDTKSSAKGKAVNEPVK